MEILIGSHLSIKGGVSKALEAAERLGFSAIQIFTKHNNQWNAFKISDKEIETFRNKLASGKVKAIVAHSSYLINLCSANMEMRKKSLYSFKEELMRCEMLNIPYLNFHPGSHGGAGIDEGIKMIAEAMNEALLDTKAASCMLELTAGQGTSIGHKFEQIASIIELVDDKERVCCCIDTAHIFAAGYDIRSKTSYNHVMEEFDSTIGLERLKCFHMNDSKKDLGTRVDRHEHIGKGFIGLEGFTNIMNDKRLKAIPKILETPKGPEYLEDVENIGILKSLIKPSRTGKRRNS